MKKLLFLVMLAASPLSFASGDFVQLGVSLNPLHTYLTSYNNAHPIYTHWCRRHCWIGADGYRHCRRHCRYWW